MVNVKACVLRTVTVFIGLFLLVLFINPISFGIFNIGNLTGIIISSVIILAGLFFGTIKKVILMLWGNIFARIIIFFVSTVLIVSVLCGLVLTGFMVHYALNSPPESLNVIVLGCKVNGSTPSLMLKDRLDVAYNYLIENPESKCILSGGQGPKEAIPESEAMYNYLINKGISPERLYKESKSKNTEENIKLSAVILKENNLGTKVVIATDGFHQMRAGLLAKNEGLKAYAVSSSTKLHLFPTYYVRELYGLMEQIILK